MQRAASELCLLESKPGIHFGESVPGGKDEHVLFPSSTRSSSIPSCCLYPRTSLLAFSIMTLYIISIMSLQDSHLHLWVILWLLMNVNLTLLMVLKNYTCPDFSPICHTSWVCWTFPSAVPQKEQALHGKIRTQNLSLWTCSSFTHHYQLLVPLATKWPELDTLESFLTHSSRTLPDHYVYSVA